VKILKGLALALTGAVVDILSEFAFKIDVGEWTPVVYIATPVIVNAVRKLIAAQTL